jgi:hypothetical protein
MGPPLKIAFANAQIADVVAKLEAIGCKVEGHSHREAGMPARWLRLKLNDIEPYSIAFIVELTGQNEAWFVYMRANRSTTLWDWLRLPFEPVFGVIEIFLPRKEHVPTEEELQLTRTQEQVEQSLKADAMFIGDGVYEVTWTGKNTVTDECSQEWT